MIKTLSPYFITTPFVSPATALTCQNYTIHLYIWNGLKASVPATAFYEETVENPEGLTGDSKISIARLLADFIELTPIQDTGTGYVDADAAWWVKKDITYLTTDPTDGTTPQLAETLLFSRGYAYGNEGENQATNANKVLLNIVDYKVNREGVFSVPVLTDEVSVSPITVISYPDNEINFSGSIIATTDSGKLVRNVWVDLSETTTDTYVEVVFNSVTVTLLIQDEYKYTPMDIFFINKEGFQQSMTFFKEKNTGLTVSNSQFESNYGQPLDGFHQFKEYNIQGRTDLSLNSGWIDEEMNEILTQLLLSDMVWSFADGVFTPLNRKTKNLKYKSRVQDRLINYEISFEDSYNKINNI